MNVIFLAGERLAFQDMPNIHHLLTPEVRHPVQVLYDGMLMLHMRIEGEGEMCGAWMCNECL